MNITPYYVVLTEFTGLGLGHACDPATFSCACDAYIEQMADGDESTVFRIDPPKGNAAGMVTDVTDDAEAEARKRYMARGYRLPTWLGGACEHCDRTPCTCDDRYDEYKEEAV